MGEELPVLSAETFVDAASGDVAEEKNPPLTEEDAFEGSGPRAIENASERESYRSA